MQAACPIEIAYEFILIELSELIIFGYDPSDAQDGLRCWRNGIYILLLTSSPCDKNSGERSRAHGPSCLFFCFMVKNDNIYRNY